jgi:hypothetical protein
VKTKRTETAGEQTRGSLPTYSVPHTKLYIFIAQKKYILLCSVILLQSYVKTVWVSSECGTLGVQAAFSSLIGPFYFFIVLLVEDFQFGGFFIQQVGPGAL